MTPKSNLLLTLLIFLSVFNAHAEFGMNTVKVSDPKSENERSLPLPPTQSQDSLGICFAMAGALLMDAENCRNSKTGSLDNCPNMKDSDRISALDASRFGNTKKVENWGQRDLYPGLVESGAVSFFLKTSLRAGSFANEKCASLDQIVNSNSDPKRAAEIEMGLWQRMKILYERAKKLDCPECDMTTMTAIDEVKQNSNIKASNQQILKALAEDSYSKFLDKMLVSKECYTDDFANNVFNSLEFRKSVEVKEFPKQNLSKDKNAYQKTLDQIKSQLSKKTPVAVTFCAQAGELKAKNRVECGGSDGNSASAVAGSLHAVVIKGYRKVCNSSNSCYDAVQIQNSWGQSWQSRNNDGWVDAKELLRRTFYDQNSLTWLERPDPKSK